MAETHQKTSSHQACLKSVAEISAAEWQVWTDLRAMNPALYSPYFHPDYTRLVDQLRDDVRILCLYDGETPLAFLPLQGHRFARPVGMPMTDYQGFITKPDQELGVRTLLRSCGIGAFHYSAIVDPKGQFPVHTPDGAAAIDISMGGDAWRAAQDASYGRYYKNYLRRVKRSIKERGPVTVDILSRDPETFETMIKWKREQFAATGKYDVLSVGWTLDLMRELWSRGPEADLRCDLFALRIDGELAAIDMGLSDGKTYHSWMVTYNKDMQRFSPGIQLLEALVDNAQTVGYQIIDLGVGMHGYKRYYTGIEAPVGTGFLPLKGSAAALSRIYGTVENLSAHDKLGKVGKLPGRLRRRYSQIAACDSSFSGRTKGMIDALKPAPKD